MLLFYISCLIQTPTYSALFSLWAPPLLMCFLALSWCYPDLRPSRVQTYSVLSDCCVNNVFCFVSYPNIPTYSSTSPLWSPPLLLSFLTLSWCYSDLRSTRMQTDFSLFDCCVNIFVVVCFLILTHAHGGGNY